MSRPAQLTFSIIAVVIAVVGVAMAMSEQVPATDHGAITKAVYARHQAVPNFDSRTKTEGNPARLAALATALRTHDWVPGDEAWNDAGCAGGVHTEMAMTYADGTTQRYDAYACGGGQPPVVEAVEDVIAGWRR